MSVNQRETAEKLVHWGKKSEHLLDYSLSSLQQDVDVLFESMIAGSMPCWECALGAYVGETLVRLFDGVWRGAFYCDNSAANYYLSFIDFGEYRYYPFHFLSYRISNGVEEGSFVHHLEDVLPNIVARTQIS